MRYHHVSTLSCRRGCNPSPIPLGRGMKPRGPKNERLLYGVLDPFILPLFFAARRCMRLPLFFFPFPAIEIELFLDIGSRRKCDYQKRDILFSHGTTCMYGRDIPGAQYHDIGFLFGIIKKVPENCVTGEPRRIRKIKSGKRARHFHATGSHSPLTLAAILFFNLLFSAFGDCLLLLFFTICAGANPAFLFPTFHYRI